MSDGFKGAVSDLPADVSEAAIKPITDEVGKAIEEGAYSVFKIPKTSQPADNPQIDPAAHQAKKADEQKRKAWALKVIDWYKRISDEQKGVRDQKKQEEQAKIQEEQQIKQVKQFEEMEAQKKDQAIAVTQAKTRTEIKGGVGG